MNCPNCNSNNVQKASIIHAQGTSTIKTQSSSVAVGSVGLRPAFGTATTTTTGTQQSVLAAALSPPQSFSSYALGFYAAILLIIGAIAVHEKGYLGSLVIFGLSAWCIYMVVQWERFNTAPKTAEWSKKWHCNSCGHVFFEPGAKELLEKTAAQRNAARPLVYGSLVAVPVAVYLTAAIAVKWADSTTPVANSPQQSLAERNNRDRERYQQGLRDFQARRDAAVSADPCGVTTFLRAGTGQITPNAQLDPPEHVRIIFTTNDSRLHSVPYFTQDGLCKVQMGPALLVIPAGAGTLNTLRQMGLTTPPVLQLSPQGLRALH